MGFTVMSLLLISANQSSWQMTTESILPSDISDTITPPNHKRKKKNVLRERGTGGKGRMETELYHCHELGLLAEENK